MEEKNQDLKKDTLVDQKIPNQKELERELSDYLAKKYGDRVKIVSPFLVPKAAPEDTDLTGPGKTRRLPRSILT